MTFKPKVSGNDQKNSSLEELLTTSQVAQLLSLKKNTLEKMRLRGDGPPFVRLGVGGAVRYDLAVVRAYIREHTFKSTSEPRGNGSGHNESGQNNVVSAIALLQMEKGRLKTRIGEASFNPDFSEKIDAIINSLEELVASRNGGRQG